MPRVVMRALPVLGLLLVIAITAIFAPFGGHIFPAADRSATVLLGEQAVYRYQSHLRAAHADAFAMRARTSGVTGDVRVYIGSHDTATLVAVGIYSNAGGHPGTLLSYGFGSALKALAWSTVSVAGAQMVSGHTYWLAVLGEGGALSYRDGRGGSCGGVGAGVASLRNPVRELPRRWGSVRIRKRAPCSISAYVLAAKGGASGNPLTSGAAPPSSTQPAPPSAPAVPKSPTQKDCFENPETEGTSRIEACGYPGPKDTGVADCSSLTPSGSVTAGTSGQKVENLNVTGTITVAASNVTINDVCVTTNGGGQLGSKAVSLEAGATGTTISNSTIHGEDESSKSVEEAISNDDDDAGATAIDDDLYNCGECIHETWSVSRSYVIVNGMKDTSDHLENWYFNDTTVSANDDTMLNPEDQTAIMFGDTNLGGGGACENHVTATGNLMAGSDYMLYPCGNASSAGTSTMTIKDNRFARCLGATRYETSTGGTVCTGGADANGYFPKGGLYGPVTSDYTGAGRVWEGNYWDNNLETAGP